MGIVHCIIFLICLFFSLSSPAAKEDISFQTHIDKLIKKHRISKSDLSFIIRDLSTDDLEYALHPEASKIPASLTKIIVAGAVLDAFDAGHKFETQLLVNNKIEAGVLHGPLYLKGFGDPSFTSERMWYLVNELMRRRIHQIQGGIIVDDFLFDAINRDPNRLTATDRAYDAHVGALSFNWNVVNVFLSPGKTKNSKAYVYLDPIADPIKLVNKVKTDGSRLRVSVKNMPLAMIGSQDKINEIKVFGSIPLNHKEKIYYRKITQPAIWTGENLRDFLRQRNIEVQGRIKRDQTPLKAQVVASSPGANIC